MIKRIIFDLLDSVDTTFDCDVCPLHYFCDQHYNQVHGCSKVFALYFSNIFSEYINSDRR